LLIACVVIAAAGFAAADEEKKAEKRAKIDGIASEALDSLFEQSPKAKELSEQAYGYAVFDNWKFAFGVSGGGGHGVAVANDGARTYMKMGTGGVGLGLGGQKYQVIFLIQDEKTFNSFVNVGWQADASASAAAGTEGASAASSFVNGIAVYQLTEAGLMANADVTGTKYWKHKKLN
jgi:lipid-binding SYLF domain-containing protein